MPLCSALEVAGGELHLEFTFGGLLSQLQINSHSLTLAFKTFDKPPKSGKLTGHCKLFYASQ